MYAAVTKINLNFGCLLFRKHGSIQLAIITFVGHEKENVSGTKLATMGNGTIPSSNFVLTFKQQQQQPLKLSDTHGALTHTFTEKLTNI